MNLLFRVVYAAHANGTHHKLALDALRHLASPEAEAWRRMFLKDAAFLMEGAKAPDDQFKDFCSHVLHVRDGYWGGAPDKVESWYGQLVEALRAERWSAAAYAAGVLSHYIVDPIHPFHTAQSEAENNIHRAVEWSISRSYAGLLDIAETLPVPALPPPTAGPAWLREIVITGAEASNPFYETLIAHYDLHAGVVDPPAGLDETARRIVAGLIWRAQHTVAVVLDRALAEAAVAPPAVDLTVDTVLAVLKVPLKLVLKKLADMDDRAQVAAMYDELKATGRVEKTLSEDDRTVRDRHALEVLVPRVGRLEEKRAALIAAAPSAAAGVPLPEPSSNAAAEPVPAVPSAPAKTAAAPAPVVPADEPDGDEHDDSGRTGTGGPRFRLAGSDDVEKGPSVGPRLAERLYGVGIHTVDDLLAADPERVAVEIGARHITAELVRDWQDQMRLVMSVPDLRGGQAQMLVGAGYRSVGAIAAADPAQLCADVLAFAGTPEGRRVLRDGAAPNIEAIKQIAEGVRRLAA